MRKPRPYQVEMVNAVRSAYSRGVKGACIEAATGLGKGMVIALVAKMVLAKGKRVLIAVNRDQLCEQLFASCREQGLMPVMERGMDRASPLSDLVVASIQSAQGARLQKWNPDHFGLVITDEVHGAAADTFKATLSHFQATYHLGFSATIERHDKAALWGGFEEIVYSMPMPRAISEGWLVPYQVEEMPVPITLSDQQANKRMWTDKDEENLFSTNDYLPRLFHESSIRLHRELPSLFFWNGCCSSRDANAYFQKQGIDSRHVDGDMKKEDIKEILDWFNCPGAKALHNADLLSYGYDNIWIGLVGIMRIVRSIPMMKQRIGRATRPACVVDGLLDAEARCSAIAGSVKPRFTILDLMLNVGEATNTFADATALITEDNEEREFLRDEQRKAGAPLTMEEIADKLKAKRETDHDAQLAKLAEDAANAARKWEQKQEAIKTVYVGDILSKRIGNPAKPEFEKDIRDTIRKGGWKCYIGHGPFTGWQLMQIKLRIEKANDKLNAARSAHRAETK